MLKNIKQDLAEFILDIGIKEPKQDIISMLELKTSHGGIALKIFKFSKNPKEFSRILVENIKKSNHPFKTQLDEVKNAGGFINFQFKSEFLFKTLIKSTKNNFLKENKKSQRVIIDYSSPNVAKPLSIGHLRSTVIGNAICNLAKSQGYDVVGINYLGDWGVQFGKLAWGYLNWKNEYDFKQPFKSLYEIYTRFHEESESNPILNEKGAECFKKLEAGDKEITDLWKNFVDVTLKEHKKIYDLLGIKFDLIQGESFFNDKIEPVYNFLKQKKLIEISENAHVVKISEDLPPCIIKKSDGASLYATRDLASMMYRKNELKGDIFLYVVGADQTLYFKQIFSVLKKANLDWAKYCHHISFGLYRFKDTKMSTRKGNVIFMSDVLEKAIEISKEKLKEKENIDEIQKIATSIGIGAIVFNDLVNDRVKNVDFSWQKALDFNGNSGPYVQYSLIRARSILAKYNGDFSNFNNNDIEYELCLYLLSFDETLENSWHTFKPHILAQYLLKVSKMFNHFYNSKKVLCDDINLRQTRLALVYCVEKVLTRGLNILGVPIPDKM